MSFSLGLGFNPGGSAPFSGFGFGDSPPVDLTYDPYGCDRTDPSSICYDPSLDPNYGLPTTGVYSQPIGPMSPLPPQTSDRRQTDWRDIIGADIGAGLKAISNIWSPAATSIAQAQPQRIYYPPTTAINPATGLPVSSQGFNVDRTGLTLFGAHVGWWTIALAAGIWYLVQHPGYSKRRNPAPRRNTGRKRGQSRARARPVR